jgi:hypothetical protein
MVSQEESNCYQLAQIDCLNKKLSWLEKTKNFNWVYWWVNKSQPVNKPIKYFRVKNKGYLDYSWSSFKLFYKNS